MLETGGRDKYRRRRRERTRRIMRMNRGRNEYVGGKNENDTERTLR